MAAACKLCGEDLETSGRLVLPCGHSMHEQCALQSQQRGASAGCPECGRQCEELMGAEALCEKADGLVGRKDFGEAARLFTAALDLSPGHPNASSGLGQLLAEGRGLERNLERAVELLQVGLASGNLGAAVKLGSMHLEGKGVRKDAKKALQLLERALAEGALGAAVQLGSMYLSGNGVRKDEERAMRYFERALLGGIPMDPDAATLMGIVCLKKKRDVDLGMQLLEIGHKMENPAASFTLWEHYKAKDTRRAMPYLEAAHWAGVAAGLPMLNAIWTWGLMHMDGKEQAKGIYLMTVARAEGHPEAVRFLPAMIGMSTEQMDATAVVAKAIFAPSDGHTLSVAQLKQRAEGLWAKVISGTSSPADFPDEVIAHVNAQRSKDVPRSAASSFTVHLIQYSRHPQSLRRALLEGPELKACRDGLAARGYSCEQPSGAKVFVAPEQFEAVVAAIEEKELKPWHVVASQDFEEAVARAVKQLPSQLQVREKGHSSLVCCHSCGAQAPRYACQRCHVVRYCSKACQQKDWRLHKQSCEAGELVVVKRTFLEVPLKNSLRSTPASADRTKSTTDADPRKGGNPRKA